MRKSFLPLSKPVFDEREFSAVLEVLRSGFLTTGPKVWEFESKMAGYIRSSVQAVAVSSCTAGLYLSLLALGIKKGDEVIVPTWTFAATAHVVLWLGAKPVLCDVEEESLNIDLDKAEKLLTKKTKALIPVHFAGYACDMDRMLCFADKYKLKIIEDAAHAVGSGYKGKKIGGFGDVSVFSFYATKNLACGEGGMCVTREKSISEKIRKLSYFGINKSAFNRYSKRGNWYYEIEDLGYKYNMDSIHAAIGLVQLKKLDAMNERRRHIASIYKQNLDQRVRFTADSSDRYHNYHLFPIIIDKNLIKREELIAELKKRNIGTSVHFIPLHKHPFYHKIVKRVFPVADEVFEEIVSIPMFPAMSDEDANYVSESINKILKRR